MDVTSVIPPVPDRSYVRTLSPLSRDDLSLNRHQHLLDCGGFVRNCRTRVIGNRTSSRIQYSVLVIPVLVQYIVCIHRRQFDLTMMSESVSTMIMFNRNRSFRLVALMLTAGSSVSAFSPPQPFGAQVMGVIRHGSITGSSSFHAPNSRSPYVMKPLLMSMREPTPATKGSDSEEVCAPEEGEYCLIDEKSGKLIKLTVAEKERIFLDALQVRLES